MPAKFCRCVEKVKKQIKDGKLPAHSNPYAICHAALDGRKKKKMGRRRKKSRRIRVKSYTKRVKGKRVRVKGYTRKR